MWFWKRTEIAHEMHNRAFTWFLCGLWYMFVLVSICLLISSLLVEVKIILCNMIMQIVSAGGLVLSDEIQKLNLRSVTLFFGQGTFFDWFGNWEWELFGWEFLACLDICNSYVFYLSQFKVDGRELTEAGVVDFPCPFPIATKQPLELFHAPDFAFMFLLIIIYHVYVLNCCSL